MNFIFFGTPKFSAEILERLIEAGFAPAGVVCNPDRPTGRKKVITPPADEGFGPKARHSGLSAG